MRPAFFFDRDGVVNISPGEGYVLRAADFHLSQGIIEALALLKARGFALILVTSQQGVGKGLMTLTDLEEIHAEMQDELIRHSAEFDGIYACTCLSSDPLCTCRKPSPEMIHRAVKEHDLDVANSWLVGDHDRDIQMALNAGVPLLHTVRICGENPIRIAAGHRLESVEELAALLGQQFQS